MLENMRRQGASIFIYLIFCLLIAIFVINFRPGQSRQSDGGCRGTTNVVVSVDGNDATQTAYHIAYANPFNRGTGKQKTYVALETLIRRELLAAAAEARGLLATDDLMIEEIKQGHFYLGGQRTMIPNAFEDIDGEKFFNNKAVKSWMGQMNVSQNSYIEEQKRSLLASMMSDLLMESVQVSRDEALAHFLYENNTVTYDVVAFKPETYRAAMRLSDADADRYLAGHEDEVKARYKADERTYKAVKPQHHLREIFIAKLAAAKPDDKKPDDKNSTDQKKPDVKPVGMPIEEAKAKLEAVRAAVAGGKQCAGCDLAAGFVAAARQVGTDDAIKASGGDLGWRSADNPSLGDKAVSDAVKALKPGEMTPVIATDRGAYLVLAEARRDGDLTYDQVKHELAQELARDTWSKEAARRAALAALSGAQTGVIKNLDSLYDHEALPQQPDMDLQKMMSDPNMSDEDKQQLLKMLMSRQHGSIEIPGKDQLAASYAGADGAGAGSGSSVGSAAPPVAPPPAAPAVDLMAPPKDPLPPMAELPRAKVTRYGPSPRAKTMPGIGASKDAAAALFEEAAPGDLGKRIYEADGAYVVVQLVSRAQPKVADFDKEADQRVAELRKSRAQAFVEDWLKDRCEKLYKDGKILPNPELIAERDDQGKPAPVQYRPCMSFH